LDVSSASGWIICEHWPDLVLHISSNVKIAIAVAPVAPFKSLTTEAAARAATGPCRFLGTPFLLAETNKIFDYS